MTCVAVCRGGEPELNCFWNLKAQCARLDYVTALFHLPPTPIGPSRHVKRFSVVVGHDEKWV